MFSLQAPTFIEPKERSSPGVQGRARVLLSKVGYAASFTPNPTYEEACSGGTGATEAVQVLDTLSLVELWLRTDFVYGLI